MDWRTAWLVASMLWGSKTTTSTDWRDARQQRWEDTIAPWYEGQGFTRGENEPCAFLSELIDALVLLWTEDNSINAAAIPQLGPEKINLGCSANLGVLAR